MAKQQKSKIRVFEFNKSPTKLSRERLYSDSDAPLQRVKFLSNKEKVYNNNNDK